MRTPETKTDLLTPLLSGERVGERLSRYGDEASLAGTLRPVRNLSTSFGRPAKSLHLNVPRAQSVAGSIGHAAVSSQLRIPSLTPSQLFRKHTCLDFV
jgi:hypothetical protein